MHKNYIWQGFLGLIFLVVLYHTALSGWRYYTYERLEATTPAAASQWSILKMGEEKYLLKTHYRFISGQQSYEETFIWEDQPLRNEYAAQKAIEEKLQKPLIVYYDASHPTVSSLQKYFPVKEFIITAILWGLFLYFLWIGFYVKKFKQ